MTREAQGHALGSDRFISKLEVLVGRRLRAAPGASAEEGERPEEAAEKVLTVLTFSRRKSAAGGEQASRAE
jgi:hypothetical protein